MQKSFLFWSLFPSEYQLPIALRASGPAAEGRRRRRRKLSRILAGQCLGDSIRGGGQGRRAETVAGPEAPPPSLPLAASFPRHLSRPQPISMLRNGELGAVWGGAQRTGSWESAGSRGRNPERELWPGCWPPSPSGQRRRGKAGHLGRGKVQRDVGRTLRGVNRVENL